MKQKSNNKLAFRLGQLQNFIKRDSSSYYDEFYMQFTHFQSLLQAFKLKPQEYDEDLADLTMFLAQVSSHFKEDLENLPSQLMDLLREYSTVLEPSMRMSLCKALILMRNRGILAPVDLIKLCFELLRCSDKILRKQLHIYIISDIKKLNMKHKNAKLNSVFQNFMFQMLSDGNATAAKMSLDVMIELYRRNIWKEAKCVNAIVTACFSKVNKILVAACQFFLGTDKEEEDEKSDSSDSEDDTPTVKEVMAANKVNKKSRKRMKILKRTKQVLKKSKKRKNKELFDFSAVHLLNDPQGIAEKLLKKLETMNERYEIKMLVMDLISRLVGVHQLILLNFYPLLLRYLKPHQRDVTKILLFAAQAAHEYVPPDVMEPVMRSIANNFITERNSPEVMTVGLNAMREICARCPLAIEQDLLQDLVQYKKFKNKNVQMAANSLIQLFRRINPQMLQRKFRNKPTEATKELNPMEYGALNAKSYIPGCEVLTVEPSKEEVQDSIKEEEANDSDGSWVNVSHSDDDIASVSDESSDEADEDDEPINVSDTSDKQQIKLEKTEHDKESKENAMEKAMVISQTRILSQEEFRKLKAAQLAKEVKFAKGHKRKAEETKLEEDTQRGELVSLKDIEKLHKKPKLDKEERLASIKEGREGREKFGSKKKKNPNTGKTQKQHNRNKAFNMIKHKVRSKQKRSFKDKQIALRNALLKRRRKK
ncbi:protein SDA1 homolog [Uloborus diversus]|uniref:protein SDA1 homolog n=1 Tax=Uloborus diversus TaxID=327109 RepID=UPI00240921EE|nr:protein SDA1 homolog [Uloborus diversus]